MQAKTAYSIGMKAIQYTIRGVNPAVDRALRDRVRQQQRSMNAVLLEVLASGLNIDEGTVAHHDLDALAGTWVEDEQCNETLDNMRKVDMELWQ